MAMRRLLVVLLVALTTQARALDAPIAATTLVMTWNDQLIGRLLFVSKDPTFLFPAIGSADAPWTGTPGGMVVWLFYGPTPAFGTSLDAPRGEGWHSNSNGIDAHHYSNPEAPFGPSPIRRVLMKRGTMLKLVSKLVPVTETPPLGRVAIRIDTGSLRNCAVFDAASIRYDGPHRFIARGALRPAGADCDEAIYGTPSTSTTTTTIPLPPCAASTPFYPLCGGDCPPGETCGPNAVLGGGLIFECACLPAGAPPCSVSGYPICGGSCLGGTVCQAFSLSGSGTANICACVDPSRTCGPPPPSQCVNAGVCPFGQVCQVTSVPSFLCGCGSP